jgi:Tol biopolymer transport system component
MIPNESRSAIRRPRQCRRSSLLFGAALAALAPTARGQLAPTTRVNVDSAGTESNSYSSDPSMSAGGRFVAFKSDATNLIASDTNGHWDVFVHDRLTGVTECESVDPSGATGNNKSGSYESSVAISGDGNFVVFESDATNLLSGWHIPRQIYLRDRSAGTTEIVSVDRFGGDGTPDSYTASVTEDGRYVAFSSLADQLVAGDTNGKIDVFVRDRVAGTTQRVSFGISGKQANDNSNFPMISSDGQAIAFRSLASNLVSGDTNGTFDVFVFDVPTQTIERVSVDSSGAEAAQGATGGAIAADGNCVAFESDSSNLVAGDTNGTRDVFVHDRTTGVTERVSVDTSGGEGNDYSYGPSISADGRYVAFESWATNLVAGDTNGKKDVFVHDRTTGITTRVSVDSSGAEADNYSRNPWISADGATVAFVSAADDLVPSDTNGTLDIFVNDGDFAAWTNYGAGFPGTNGVPTFTSSGAATLGTTITLDLANSCGQPTVGLLFAGVERATLHTNRGGDLLLLPLLAVPITFSFGGSQFVWSLPADDEWIGLTIDLQAVEADAGAAKGVSFTAGLELAVGF